MNGIDRPREERLRKIALRSAERRHVGHPGDSLAQPRALVVGEEEHAVGDNRPADRTAELVAVVVGRRLVSRRERVAAVERTVPEELVAVPAKRLAPDARDDVDLAGSVAAERRVVGRGLDAELVDARRPAAGRRRVPSFGSML